MDLTFIGLLAACVLGALSGFAQDDEGLRGVFVGKADPSVPDRVVGRMAIRLRQEDGTWERVRADHPFRSGDRFRFEVESNHDGRLASATYSDDLWLYFSPSEEDERYLAVLELRLCHESAAGE